MRWFGGRERADGEGSRKVRPARGSRRSLRRAALLWGLVSALLTGGLVFLFFFSAAFVVEDIKVKGVKGRAATETVIDLARVPHGRPLARVSESRVAELVLEDLRFAEVRLHREWPSAITIEVIQRAPALALRHGSSYSLSDEHGVVYGQRGRAPEDVPVIRVAEEPGQLSGETVAGLLDLLAHRPGSKVLEGKMSTPVLAADGTVSMRVEQLTIEWGEPVEAEKKWAVISALVAQDSIDPTGGVPQTIDVRLPGQPVVTGIPPAQG